MNPLLASILASVSDKDAAKVIRELNRIEDAKQDTREPGEDMTRNAVQAFASSMPKMAVIEVSPKQTK